jgi:hypothetical protein
LINKQVYINLFKNKRNLFVSISENNPFHSSSEFIIEEEKNESIVDSDEDDFHDLPSEFDDDDDLFLDESIDNNGDMEFLRNSAKNLMSSLKEMEEATENTNIMDAPHSLLYGDDYIVTIKNRRFALAFLDYTQYRVEKQRNSDKFRLLASLKKLKTNKKRLENSQQYDQILINETKTNKKKRNKRNKKKKNATNKGIQFINLSKFFILFFLYIDNEIQLTTA